MSLMSNKPILLVDVDGVLNVFGLAFDDDNGGMGEPNALLEKVFEAEAGSSGVYPRFFVIRFPAGLTERMKRLAEHFDFAWATTWANQAPISIAPELGMGHDWPVIVWGGGGRGATWKLDDVAKWVRINAVDRRVAWVDDDLHQDAESWATERGDTFLAVCIPDQGLDDAVADRLIAWAQSVSQPAPSA